MPRTSREVALEVLRRVDADGAWSGVLLRRALDRGELSAPDEALATDLTLGTLRHRAEVDWALAQVLRRPLETLPPAVRTVLRLGAYQILFLDRVPAAAACSESVELAKRVGHPGTVRLVNAVLRRLADLRPRVPEDDGSAERIALRTSHPLWLVRRWIDRFGVEEARELCEANNRTPPSAIRLNTLRGEPERLAGLLEEAGVATRPSAFLPEGRRIVAASREAREAAYRAGLCTPQDEGAMLVARLVAPRPGETVIDACAAPGGKTTHMAPLMENTGRIVACDVVPWKLEVVERQCERLGVTNVELRVLDAAHLGDEYPEAADRVLVDAPCSGLGVVRRRPEIKWRVRPEQLGALAARQRRILGGAARAVRPGGLLVYSVCTLEPEEGQEVIARFLDEHPEFAPDSLEGWPPGAAEPVAVPGPPGTAYLLPHRCGTDGFFVAALRRVA